MQSMPIDELKHKIRRLKRVEQRIRFSNRAQTETPLVWDKYFDLHDNPSDKAKYTLYILAGISYDEYKKIVDEYFALVYYEFYKENGLLPIKLYDPAILSQLGLPFNAGEKDVKKKFRELAKEYHPDNNGDATKFNELMAVYKNLIGG